MAKLRDREPETSENRSDDDFEKVPKKKRKTGVPKSFKDRGKASTSKGKTETVKLFRGNLGPLHDLFHDIEERGHTLNNDQLGALRSTPLWSMLQVFVGNKINKDELSKNNHGLEMLLKSYTKSEDGNSGFKFVVGFRLFVLTPADMAVIFGMQLIENGIKKKILNECHITPKTSDLYQKYKFGAGLPVIRSTEFAEHSSLVDKRKGAKEMTPRFSRWDARSISNPIALLEKLPCTNKQVNERKLVTPIKQQSRIEKMEIRAINLENENVVLIVSKGRKGRSV
ncbi:hypothetical protein MKX01_015855 [Papaver californicum]|nr:hypothetical protein MKX01_015855 [Papaver californicum]